MKGKEKFKFASYLVQVMSPKSTLKINSNITTTDFNKTNRKGMQQPSYVGRAMSIENQTVIHSNQTVIRSFRDPESLPNPS